jgi:VWFA-related protein
MRRIISVLFLTLAIALAQIPSPQAFQPQPADTVIHITVNLVQVDAVVMDSKDKPVTDLRKEDFVILQDGKPQVITNFSFINTKEGVVRTAPAKPAPVAKGAKLPPPPPAIATRPKQVRRTVALVVDDLGLSFESIARVRQSLKRYVDREMQPGDVVGIIRTGSGMGSLQQFTSNKQLLYAAIDHVKYNSFGRVGISSIAPLQGIDPQNPIETANFDNERAQIFSAGTLGAIQYVVEGLRELPGRKSVVLFSENLKLMYGGEQSQRVQDSIRRLGDAANRASVVIYSIDPRGLQTTSLTAADDTRGRTAHQISQIPMQRSQEIFDSQEGMVILAHETGGLFMQNTNDIDGALRHVMQDGEGYYLIGYHPDASTFDAKSGRPKFHNMQVRVKRAGLQVRNRSGFFGTSDRETEPVLRTRQAQIARAMISPTSGGALHLRLTTLFSHAAKTGPFLNSMLYFDPKELTFTDEPDDWHKAVIDVVAVTFGDNGQQVDGTDKTWTVRLRGDGYKEVLKNGMVYAVHVPVKKPGAYQVRVVLRDAGSELLGSASQFIEVPDIEKGHLALSGIVLRNELPQASVPAGADHADHADHAEGHQVEADPQGTPAVRIFKQGTAITYGYQILNAQADAANKPELDVQTRLFRDGEEVYTGKPMPLPVQGQEDPKRLIGGGRMQLGGKITPGDYVLQVIVTDKLAKEKYRVATQAMDFEIQAAAPSQP